MKVTLCIGSSCRLKGAYHVVERIKTLVGEYSLGDSVELDGVFCMHRCGNKGVSVTVDGEFFSVLPEETDSFFDEHILAKFK